jgi:hypothetical protein
MHRFRQLTIILALFATILAAAAGSAGDTATQARIRAAVERGLDWIERHPASVQDGGLADMLDEGVGFLVLSTLPGDAAERERMAARFRERMAALGALPEFARWASTGQTRLTDFYHLVLAAHLMQQAGTPTDQQPVIVARTQQVLAATPRCDPTKRLTIALFLERLDEEPVISIPAALAASRIEGIARGRPPVLPAAGADPQQRLAASLYLYALVHEIVALTDFGREPPPPWLAARMEPLRRFITEAVAWADTTGNVDLLSELLLTARFIDAPLKGIQSDILQLLLSSQQSDGSWGDAPTNRPNKRRHAVITATAALWSFTARAE